MTMPIRRMKSVSRGSISDEFEVSCECPIPSTPTGGARIRVYYAGACYTDLQVRNSGQKRLRSPGIMDTSLFPGYEISGVVDQICTTVSDLDLVPGDRVILYPDANTEDSIKDGVYAEYITVTNVNNLIKIPHILPLEVASLLPCGALRGYSAVQRAKPFLQMKMAEQAAGSTNMLIVGAGGLALWTLQLAKHFISGDCNRVKTTVADTNMDKLLIAKEHGCYDIIHWNDSIHEEYIIERTKDVCPGGVDVIIDFVSSPRTINRSLKVLKQDGVLLVGGNSNYQVPICLNSLAQKNHSVLGVQRGTKHQLEELVHVFSQGVLNPPLYNIYPVDEANKVFDMLNSCKINGRAVLRVCSEEEEEGEEGNGEFSVFLPSPESDTSLEQNHGY